MTLPKTVSSKNSVTGNEKCQLLESMYEKYSCFSRPILHLAVVIVTLLQTCMVPVWWHLWSLNVFLTGFANSTVLQTSFIVCISGVVVVLYAATLIFAVFSFILIYLIGNVFSLHGNCVCCRPAFVYIWPCLCNAVERVYICTGCPVASLIF